MKKEDCKKCSHFGDCWIYDEFGNQAFEGDDECPCGGVFYKRNENKHGLKPCPFCGSEDILLIDSLWDDPISIDKAKYWYVECMCCEVRTVDCFDYDATIFGFEDGKEMAITNWNMRV
jgi:Lar family restriction alleviation protein